MSIDPSEIAGSTIYEANPGSIPTTFIPTTSAGGVGFMVMSYPGRPPMVPGIPAMPPTMAMPYMQLGAPPPLMQAVMPMPPHMIPGPPMPPLPGPPMRPYRPHHPHHPPHHGNSTVRANSYSKRQNEPSGPPVTVFVGNITERAPDAMIRHILAACGHVVSWKRVQALRMSQINPDSGLRAIRLLHDMDLGGKKLVVKVDAKTKTVLDEYKAERRRKLRGRSPLQDEAADEDDYMDEAMKQSDKLATERIAATMEDYESDMNNYSGQANKDRTRADSKDRKISKTQEKLMKLSQGQGQGQETTQNDAGLMLDDVDIEEGKRDLITREIGKFREIMKSDEIRIVRELSMSGRDRDRDRGRDKDRPRTRTPSHSPSPRSRSRSRTRELSRSNSPESGSYSNKVRSKARERARRSHSRFRHVHNIENVTNTVTKSRSAREVK
ncbi:hypothetical protein L9F63_018283, partial [Diploptera punctata]